jgi:hypothetical protein
VDGGIISSRLSGIKIFVTPHLETCSGALASNIKEERKRRAFKASCDF